MQCERPLATPLPDDHNDHGEKDKKNRLAIALDARLTMLSFGNIIGEQFFEPRGL
jgi:hypothetical protein